MRVMQLTDDAEDCEAGGVDVETNREIEIKMTKHGSGGKMTFEFVKGFLRLG